MRNKFWAAVFCVIYCIILCACGNERVALSDQEATVIDVRSDIKELKIEAMINLHNGGKANMHLFVTNDSDINLLLCEKNVCHKSGDSWIECSSSPDSLLIEYGVLCKEAVLGSEDKEADNSVSITVYPWSCYSNMDALGEYRMEFYIKSMSGENLGSAWIEWRQEKTE